MIRARPRTLAAVVIIGAALACGGPDARAAEGDRARAASLFAEGQEELAAGRLTSALRLLDEAAGLAPEVPQVRYARALALYAVQDDARALSEFREVVRLEPGHAAAWNGIGNVHNRRREPLRALEAYERAMQLDPELLLAAWHAGWTAEQIEKLDRAEAAYRRCLAATPRAPHERQSWREARFRLGALRYRARDYREAAALMSAVVRDEPAHPRAHHYLGQALVRSGRVDEGRRHLARHDELARARQRGGSVASADSR